MAGRAAFLGDGAREAIHEDVDPSLAALFTFRYIRVGLQQVSIQWNHQPLVTGRAVVERMAIVEEDVRPLTGGDLCIDEPLKGVLP